MRRNIISGLLLLVGLTTSAQGVWTELFNGKNLNGWVKYTGTAEFRVENGEIVGISRQGSPNTFLATRSTYGDFILEFDFRVDEGLNSGVQFRSHVNTQGRVYGYQFEIDPSVRAWSGGIYDEAREGWLYPMSKNPKGQSAMRRGQWNRARIEAVGDHIVTFINGAPCANLLDAQDSEGFIALQVHDIGNNRALEGKSIRWRNIRICTAGLDAMQSVEPALAPQYNAIPNTVSTREANDGWRLLWDGSTTEGWRGARLTAFPSNGWKIEEGVLSVMASDGGESANGGDIVTIRKYKDFELVADFKITRGANGGIKYFVDTELNRGEGSSIGCEYQILDDLVHPDAKLGVKGNRTLGSLYDLIPAPDDKPFRAGFYNTARIVVVGNHVEHWLNDVKILEYERNNAQWNALVSYSKYEVWPNFGNSADGHILLQDHGDNVMFRSIKIREL